MSKIEWTEKTWNIITGCFKISEGCTNCYAERMTKRLAAMGQKKYAACFNKIAFHPEELKRDFGKKPKMIFVNSMSDTFQMDILVSEIAAILSFFMLPRNLKHTFQVLTKRSRRLRDFSYPYNVWLGVTVEKENCKHRINDLKRTDARIKFLSCEPLLEDLGELDLTGINWVICGGESGPNARPVHPDWVRNIQRQCQEQNVSFFFKQWGEWVPYSNWYEVETTNSIVEFALNVWGKDKQLHRWSNELTDVSLRVGKKKAGSLLDGVEYKEFPKVVQHE